jgi:hypothetical protein
MKSIPEFVKVAEHQLQIDSNLPEDVVAQMRQKWLRKKQLFVSVVRQQPVRTLLPFDATWSNTI